MSSLDERSITLRSKILDVIENSRCGHIGPSYSLIEIMRVLYDNFLNINAEDPCSPDRDRLILSKGHGCLALYVMLCDKKFITEKELLSFCKYNSILGGHPERHLIPGVEASTGALGHGLSVGCGIAVAAKLNSKCYRTVVITGDGELNEGSIWEAAAHCSKHKLNNLLLIVDQNNMQCHGDSSKVLPNNQLDYKFESFGFKVATCDGHNISELKSKLYEWDTSNAPVPSALICKTIKGKGIPSIENNPAWHYSSSLNKEKIDNLRAELFK